MNDRIDPECPRCEDEELVWHDGYGYQCPKCSLFVAIPKAPEAEEAQPASTDLESQIRKVLAESDHGHVDVVDALVGVAKAYAEAQGTEWEYRIVQGDLIRYTQARAEAVRARSKGHDVRQRRPRFVREAGPWEPVEEVPA